MAFNVTADPPPKAPPASVRRFDAEGRPTQAQIEYEARLLAWMKRVAAAIP